MKKVVLFNNPLVFEHRNDVFEMQEKFIRYGILSLATYLSSRGYSVKVFDYYDFVNDRLKQEIKDELLKFAPNFVGIPAFSTEIYNAAATAQFIKEVLGKKVKVLIGGPHVSALPEETLTNFSGFDVGVLGEGELTTEEIMKGRKLSEIEGIIYRDERGSLVKNQPRKELADISRLPMPKYEFFDLKKYIQPVYRGVFKTMERKLILPIETTRGCPFDCKFCFRTIGRQVRFKKPELVLREIKRLVRKYGVNQMEVIDGTFGIWKEHALKICELLKKEGIDKIIRFSVMCRANTLDEDIAKALKTAGCFYIGIGVESGSDDVLRRSGKGITTDQIRRVISVASKHGIEVHSYFILGLPGETATDIKKTAIFAKSLAVMGANFAILVPFPGTEIYSYAQKGKLKYRLATKDYRLYGKQEGGALINENISHDELKRLQEYCYRQFYFSSVKRFLVFLTHLNWQRTKGIFKLLFKNGN